MIHFKGNVVCSRCGKQYDWVFMGPGNGEFIAGRWDERIKNAINYNATNQKGHYVVETQCPSCLKREFVETIK